MKIGDEPTNQHRMCADALRRLHDLALQLGDTIIARDAANLARRVESGQFYVACVGQFKRGKSTLIDALVGDRLLPVGIVPVTAVPTIVRHGEVRRTCVHFRDGTTWDGPIDAVGTYVSQESNPNNAKRVDAVEVFTPSPLLTGGMCLVDTPGLGSVFAANSDAARAFVPQIDVAILVLGADPPLSGAELDLVVEIAEQVRDFVVVLNKADRSSEAELDAATEFTRKVLDGRLQIPVGSIFQVSALRQWEGGPPWRDWNALTAALAQLQNQAVDRIQITTRERAEKRISRHLLGSIEEEMDALRRPLGELAAKLARMRDHVALVERSLGDLGALLTNEQFRLARQLGARRRAFLAKYRAAATQELQEELSKIRRVPGPSFRRVAFQAAQRVAKEALFPWLSREQVEVEREYGKSMQRFIQMANDFVKRASEGGIEGIPMEGFFVERSRFQFEGFITVAQPASPLRFLADAALGLVGAYRAISQDAVRFLDHLLETNASRVESDFIERVDASRIRLEAEIKERLQGLIDTSERVLQRTAAAHRAGDAAMAEAMVRLRHLKEEVQRIAEEGGHQP